ncbi:MAG: hypothetical protein ACRD2Z_04860 [Thermoanaerobaculia bacterium]
MVFRIGIGQCDCSQPYRDAIQELACGIVEARLDDWRQRLPADLHAVPVEHYEHELIEGHKVSLATYREELDDGDALVAVSVLVHTLSRPSFISIRAIGRIFSEGLLVRRDGSVKRASDEIMSAYR